MRIIRAGEHIQHIPGYGISVRESGVAVAAASNWWEVPGKTCVAAYQPKGAASLAASYVNLANPGINDAAPGNAPTFNAATGWGFVTKKHNYLITGLVPVRAAWTFLVQYSGCIATLNCCMLGVDAVTRGKIHLGPYWYGDRVLWENGEADIVAAPAKYNGNLAMAATNRYRDGVLAGTGGAGSGVSTASLEIGRYDNTYTGWDFTGNIQAIAVYSEMLSDAEVATVAAAMAAL